jgi:hypothetical protein
VVGGATLPPPPDGRAPATAGTKTAATTAVARANTHLLGLMWYMVLFPFSFGRGPVAN